MKKYLWLAFAVAGLLTTGMARAADVAAHQHGAAPAATVAAKDGKDHCAPGCCSREAVPTSTDYLRH